MGRFCGKRCKNSTDLMKGQALLFTLVEFADRLRRERKARGLNQTDFAALGGVGLQSQSRYEKAENEPSAAYLANLALAGIDVAFILSGERSADLVGRRESALVSLCRQLPDDFVEAMIALARAAAGAPVHARQQQQQATLHDKKIDYRPD